MNIVHVSNYTAPAKDSQGTQRVLESLAIAQIEDGHKVYICANEDSKFNFPAELVNTIPDDADIVHYHGGFPEVYGHKHKKPWVSTNHGGGLDTLDSYTEDQKRHIVAVSEFTRKNAGARWCTISCVTPNDFIFKKEKQDYFLWIGGTDWGEQKGLFSVISLAKKARIKLKIAGTGNNKEIIRKVKEGCTDKIQFLGSVNGKEKAELIASAKAVFMIGKILDACPVVTMEAQMSGTPIIARNNSCHPEMVIHNKTGFLCDTDTDIFKAVLNITKISTDDCRDHAMREFSNIKSSRNYIKIYEEAISDTL